MFDEYLQIIGWKKLSIILVTISLFIFFLLFLSVSSSKTSQSTTASNIKVAQEGSSPTSKPLQSNFLLYTTSSYQIFYPKNWIVKENSVISGGLISHFLTSQNTTFPRIDIQVTPIEKDTPLGSKIKTLSVLQLQQSEDNIAGQRAIKLSGVLPFTLAGGNPPTEKKVIKTYLLFVYKSNSFTIDYACYQDQTSEVSKSVIATILAGLQLK